MQEKRTSLKLSLAAYHNNINERISKGKHDETKYLIELYDLNVIKNMC